MILVCSRANGAVGTRGRPARSRHRGRGSSRVRRLRARHREATDSDGPSVRVCDRKAGAVTWVCFGCAGLWRHPRVSCAWTGCVGVCDAILSALIAVCFLVVGAPATLLMRRCTAYWSSYPRSTSTSSSRSNSVPLAVQQPTCYHNPATWFAQCRRVRSLVRAEATVTGCGARGQNHSTALFFWSRIRLSRVLSTCCPTLRPSPSQTASPCPWCNCNGCCTDSLAAGSSWLDRGAAHDTVSVSAPSGDLLGLHRLVRRWSGQC